LGDDDEVSLSTVDASEMGVLVDVVESDDGIHHVDSARRPMSDTFIGIVVGVLTVVILLIVVVSVVVGCRLRRKKYSGSGASPSKFVFASTNLRHANADCSQTLPLGAVRFMMFIAGVI